jgi:cysteine desulfurase
LERIYLDNAATTPIDPKVIDVMTEFMKQHFGNPSSTHAYGRKVKDAIETCRRRVAQNLNCSPSEICFTSGGTEADNLAIYNAIHKLGVKAIITSPIEHAAVVRSCEEAEKQGLVKVHHVNLDNNGRVDMDHLDALLDQTDTCLVTLMHANNEIANLLDIQRVSELCRTHKAYFMSDTVQTMAHYKFDMEELDIDFLTGAAHKFHGPKGVGFLYHKRGIPLVSMVQGGGQERGKRSGTENIYGIIGMTEAFDIANRDLDAHQKHVRALKSRMKELLTETVPGISFNGESGEENSLYTVLSCNLPETDIAGMILFRLDIEGVACSGGSACASGNTTGSHVLSNIELKNNGPNIRFSFSHMNTMHEIEQCVNILSELMSVPVR